MGQKSLLFFSLVINTNKIIYHKSIGNYTLIRYS